MLCNVSDFQLPLIFIPHRCFAPLKNQALVFYIEQSARETTTAEANVGPRVLISEGSCAMPCRHIQQTLSEKPRFELKRFKIQALRK